MGDVNVVDKDPTMAGDDFSEFSLPDHSIPACMFNVGAVDPSKTAEAKKTGASLPSLHSSKFLPLPEPTIRVGIIGMTSAVRDLLKKSAELTTCFRLSKLVADIYSATRVTSPYFSA